MVVKAMTSKVPGARISLPMFFEFFYLTYGRRRRMRDGLANDNALIRLAR